MEYISDLQLLQLIKENDTVAFRALYDRFWEKLYRYAWKRLKSKHDAEDVVQHVFMKLWEHRSARNIQSVEQYLYKSVYYEVLDVLKNIAGKNEDFSELNEAILPSFNNIHQKIGTSELDRIIEDAISKLPPKMQEIYRLSREEDLSVNEIAARLNISEQTVKNQLTTALSRLRKPLTETLLLMVCLELTFT